LLSLIYSQFCKQVPKKAISITDDEKAAFSKPKVTPISIKDGITGIIEIIIIELDLTFGYRALAQAPKVFIPILFGK